MAYAAGFVDGTKVSAFVQTYLVEIILLCIVGVAIYIFIKEKIRIDEFFTKQ